MAEDIIQFHQTALAVENAVMPVLSKLFNRVAHTESIRASASDAEDV